MIRKLSFWVGFFLITLTVSAQQIDISGIVTDLHTNEPIAFGSVYLSNSKVGKITDSIGGFSFGIIYTGQDSLIISCIGYETQKIAIDSEKNKFFNVLLTRSEIIPEVIITAKYDRGIQTWKRIMKNKHFSERFLLDNFQYEAYGKIQVDIKNLQSSKAQKSIFFKPFSFVFKTINSLADSSDYIPAYLIESLTEKTFQLKPKKYFENIKAINTKGMIGEGGNQLLSKINQDIDIFGNNINILGQNFVSPFHEEGDKYYLFFVTETQIINGEKSYHFIFRPKRSGTNTFTGDAWVSSETYLIKNITLYLGKEANVNYIDRISIFQEFSMLNDSINFLTRDKIFADFKIVGNDKLTFIAKKSTSYKKIKVNNDTITSLLKTQKSEREVKSDDNEELKNEIDWKKIRHDSLTIAEQNIYQVIQNIQTSPKYQTLQNLFKFFGSGYVDLGALEIGKWYRFYNYNSWEGNRFQLDIGTNKYFSKNHHLHGYLAYGSSDKSYKGLFEAYWIIKRKPYWSKINFIYSSDLSNGINANYNENKNNLFPSFFRKQNTRGRRFIYHDKIMLDYFKEWGKGISSHLFVSNQRFKPLKNLPLAVDFPAVTALPLTTFEMALKLRFSYLEKFVENNYTRHSLSTPYPVFEVVIVKGIPDVLQSAYKYTKLSFSLKGMVRSTPIKSIKYKIFGGKILGNVPFTFLENHAGNDFYVYEPNSYNLINCFEYLSDQYGGVNVENDFGSGFFQFFALTRKMKLRQFWNAKALWGKLSKENNQLNNGSAFFKTLNNSTYMEVGTGIDNIFRVFRIDLIFHVLPKSLPSKTNNFGVFGSLHFNF